MYRIYSDGRHHLMEASFPDRLPHTHSNSPQANRASLGQNSSVCHPLYPSFPLLFSSLCRVSHFVTPSVRLGCSSCLEQSLTGTIFRAPLPSLRICLSVHAFTDLHLGTLYRVSIRFVPFFLFVFYRSLRYSFIFLVRSLLFILPFATF